MQQTFRFAAAVLLAAVAIGAAPVRAQDYPTRNITIVVPYPAGGPTDMTARTIAPKLSEKLGQNVIVENVSGGGTTIAMGRVARATPDGHTLLLHNLQISINVALYTKTPYDTEKDFTPIAFVNRNPLVLIGRTSIPANTLPELLAWMKANPARAAYPGPGSSGHLVTTLFEQAAGTKIHFIPYRGAAPAMNDLVGGHVDLFFATPQSALQPVREKQVKLFGIAAKDDLPDMFPGAPNFVKQFGPQLDVQFWHVLVAPSATPKPVVDKINRALQEVLNDPTVLQPWAVQGVSPYPPDQRSPEAAKAMLSSEIARWGKVVRDNNIQAPTN